MLEEPGAKFCVDVVGSIVNIGLTNAFRIFHNPHILTIQNKFIGQF